MNRAHRLYGLQPTVVAKLPPDKPRQLPFFYRALQTSTMLSETCITWIYAISRLTDTSVGDVLTWDAQMLLSAIIVYRWDCILTDAHRIAQASARERARVRSEVLRKGDDGRRAVRVAHRLARRS